MDSPLLPPRAGTCGTSVTSRAMIALPPPMDPNENCIVPVNESIECMPSDGQQYWKNPCIYRVPALITNLNPKDYQPDVVSFGPYHHGDDHLLPMEEHKRRARDHLLERSGKTLEPFLESLREVEQDLKETYDTLDPKWKEGMEGQFLALMITDGCFMLEIMRATMEKNDYAPNDPIFSTHRLAYITPYIRRDMLMLENQLPMLVLYQLIAVENNGKEHDEYINELVLQFYSLDTGIKGMGRCLHVVDVFRKGLLMDPEKDQHEMENAGPEGDKSALDTCITGMGHVVDVFRKCLPKKTKKVQHKEIIRSATELHEAGIRFRKSNTSSLKDISFARGVLKLPAITVDDTAKSMFLNVMTFERLHIGVGTGVTSYVNFMDNIINDRQDVALLHAQGIIQNAIGSDKAVAKLFNSLCQEVTVKSHSSLKPVQKDISEYCEQPWNLWRANLHRTYFRSPWTILSLTAAIFLFMLTIIQTIYIVLTYY
ncbi:hypothetical protein BT93_J1025 [Corymbia citriodora subsp. variegata]|nr:hypothetical protein BT93_J1025 [Corymbia citriodora subsp. variegata]